jgi:hypothetical protein
MNLGGEAGSDERGSHISKRAAQYASLMLVAMLELSGGVVSTLSRGPRDFVLPVQPVEKQTHVAECPHTQPVLRDIGSCTLTL